MTLLSANQNAYIFRANDNCMYSLLKFDECWRMMYKSYLFDTTKIIEKHVSPNIKSNFIFIFSVWFSF